MASSLPDNLTPDSIDTLTELATILAQLRPTVQSSASTSTSALGLASLPSLAGAGGTPTGTTGATPAPGPGAVTGTTPLPATAPNTTGAANAPLTFKELPAATDNLKHKLQRARVAVRSLPDISRSIKQQDTEIQELEALKARQLAQLATLKSFGLDFGTMG